MKRISVVLAILLTMSFFTVTLSAATYAPYSSYEYNAFDESVPAPVGYVVNKSIDAASIGLDTPFDDLCDIVIKNKIIYVLDSGNSRVIALDASYNLIKTYENFTISEELSSKKIIEPTDGTVRFTGASGIAVGNDGKIYIADTKNDRVLIANEKCEIVGVILRPDDALNDTGASFSPSAIEVDDKNWVYVASESISLGIMVFDEKGQFQQFFGANKVTSTTEALVHFFRETFMTITQLEFVEQKTPVTISKMDFDKNGFMYTVSPYENYAESSSTEGLIKKLNFNGDNILDPEVLFGDLELTSDKTWFVDIDVDDDGLVNMLDGKKGRVFQYTDDGILLNVFGTKGDQVGCFANPAAIESMGNTVFAVDNMKNCIFVYAPTEYGNTVRNAMLLMKNNDVDGSESVWRELLKMNSNSQLCYEGLGRIYDYKGDYKTAMKYYKLAYDQENYSLAFKQQRQIFIENNIVWLGLALLLLAGGIVIAVRCYKRYAAADGSAYSKMEQKYTIELYALIHPLQAFPQFKRRNISSYRVSVIIVLLWFFTKVFEYNCTGFAFSINRNKDFKLSTTILATIGIFLVFVISNWALCTLLDGKGTLKDITATTAYSLIPYIITRVIMVVMTNMFVQSESVYIQIVSVIGILWTALILILGMLSIHEFSLSKTIFALLLTVFGMMVIIFLAVLILSLFQQMVNFGTSVYKEILFRS